jgi:hypothetical protein
MTRTNISTARWRFDCWCCWLLYSLCALVTRIPVPIVYGTATVNEENQIRFFDDIYGYDAELDQALVTEHP